VNRLTTISDISIGSVMTPLDKVQMAETNSDRTVLTDKLSESAFTRLPVYETRPANIVGFINIYNCLNSSAAFSDLRDFVKPIRKLPANTTVTDAINIMQRESQKIILVISASPLSRQRSLGIVTMKDLVEEMLGELTEW